MFLSDRDLRLAMTPEGGINRQGIKIPGGLRVQPLYEPIQPGSIELRLGHTYIRPIPGIVHYRRKIRPVNKTYTMVEDLILVPGDFVNVSTLEYVSIPPGLGGILSGKSMMARDGLQVECAGWVEEGWSGRLTLELKNLGPNALVLTPGDVICQLRIELASDEAARQYGHPDLHSHYQGATTVQMGDPTLNGAAEGMLDLDYLHRNWPWHPIRSSEFLTRHTSADSPDILQPKLTRPTAPEGSALHGEAPNPPDELAESSAEREASPLADADSPEPG